MVRERTVETERESNNLILSRKIFDIDIYEFDCSERKLEQNEGLLVFYDSSDKLEKIFNFVENEWYLDTEENDELESFLSEEELDELNNKRSFSFNTDDEISGEFNAWEKSEIEKFNDWWKELEGDRNTEFWVDSVFFVRFWETIFSEIWLVGSQRAKFQILEDAGDSFRVKINWTDLEFEDDHLELFLPKDWDFWDKINKEFSYKVFKFKNLETLNDFSNYVSNINENKVNLEWVWDITKWVLRWNEVEVSSDGKNLQKKNDEGKNEKIEYFGKEFETKDENDNENNVMFKVEFSKDSVHVVYEWGWYEKNMDYSSFFIFVSEKWLNPYTNSEYQIYKEKTSFQNKPKTQLRWSSIPWIVKYLKNIPEWIKKQFNERDDLNAAYLYSKIMSNPLMQKIWWEFASEAMSRLDDKIWSMIQSKKEVLSKIDKEGSEWGIHAGRSVKFIENEVFNKSNVHKSRYLKSAGYLLFAVERWGSPYFRELNKYSNSWMWVKAILWSDHQRRYLSRVRAMITELEKKPDNKELKDKIVKEEIMYIAKIAGKNKEKFGSKFPSFLEDVAVNQFKVSKTNEIYQNQKETKNFSEIEDAYVNWFIPKRRDTEGLWFLMAMSEKVGDNNQYYRWYASMLLPLLTWTGFWNWDNNLRKEYEKLGRTFGLPLSFYINDVNWAEKVATLLDFIWRKKWINPSFKDFINRDYYREKVGFFNADLYKEKKAAWWTKNLFEAVNEWLKKNWENVTQSLNLGDVHYENSLLSKKNKFESKTVDELKQEWEVKNSEEVEIVKDYVDDKLFDDWSDFSSLEMEEPVFVDNWLYAFSGSFFDKYMFRIKPDWEFVSSNWKIWWKVLNKRMKDIKDDEVSSELFRFMFRKFVNWFSNSYGEGIKSFYAAFNEDLYKEKDSKYKGKNLEKEDLMNNLVKEYLTNQFSNNNPPSYAVDTLGYFRDFFLKNFDKVDQNFLKDLLGENSENFQAFLNPPKEDLKKFINDKKQNKKFN